MREIVTSRDNAQIKRLLGLVARKKERDESGCFAAEGLRLCLDAADSGVRIAVLLLTEDAAERYPQTAGLMAKAGRIVWISRTLADRIADTKSPQGVFAILEKLDNSQSAVTIKSDGRYLLLASLQDPGNLGTILRAAEAMGVDGVFVSADCPDVYSPKVLRGSMGGVFRLRVSVGDIKDAVERLRSGGVTVYAAALAEDARMAGTVDFSGGGAVLIGNEGGGLAEDLIAACDASIHIPMKGRAESLNAAVAAGILLWEMAR